eukprot:Anaeramoba_ignava/a451_126.p1 GENE.a451_126~~a451_126.p1  ORF type:complete len:1542 (-),score=494.07 a451_126:34-4659(-)
MYSRKKKELLDWISMVINQPISIKDQSLFSQQLLEAMETIFPDTPINFSKIPYENFKTLSEAGIENGIEKNVCFTAKELMEDEEKLMEFISGFKKASQNTEFVPKSPFARGISRQISETEIKINKQISKDEYDESRAFLVILSDLTKETLNCYFSQNISDLKNSIAFDFLMKQAIAEYLDKTSQYSPHHVIIIIEYENYTFKYATPLFSKFTDRDSSLMNQFKNAFKKSIISTPIQGLSLFSILDLKLGDNSVTKIIANAIQKSEVLDFPVKYKKLHENEEILEGFLHLRSEKIELNTISVASFGCKLNDLEFWKSKESKNAIVIKSNLLDDQWQVSFPYTLFELLFETIKLFHINSGKILFLKGFTGMQRITTKSHSQNFSDEKIVPLPTVDKQARLRRIRQQLEKEQNEKLKQAQLQKKESITPKQDLFELLHEKENVGGDWSYGDRSIKEAEKNPPAEPVFESVETCKKYFEKIGAENWNSIVARFFASRKGQMPIILLYPDFTQKPGIIHFGDEHFRLVLEDGTRVVRKYESQLELSIDFEQKIVQLTAKENSIKMIMNSYIDMYTLIMMIELKRYYRGNTPDKYHINGEMLGVEEETNMLVLYNLFKKRCTFLIRIYDSQENQEAGLFHLEKEHFSVIFQDKPPLVYSWNDGFFKISRDTHNTNRLHLLVQHQDNPAMVVFSCQTSDRLVLLYRCFDAFKKFGQMETDIKFLQPNELKYMVTSQLDLKPGDYEIDLPKKGYQSTEDFLKESFVQSVDQISEEVPTFFIFADPNSSKEESKLDHLKHTTETLYIHDLQNNSLDSLSQKLKQYSQFKFEAVALNKMNESVSKITIILSDSFFVVQSQNSFVVRKYSSYSILHMLKKDTRKCRLHLDELHYVMLSFPSEIQREKFSEKFQNLRNFHLDWKESQNFVFDCSIRSLLGTSDCRVFLLHDSIRFSCFETFTIDYPLYDLKTRGENIVDIPFKSGQQISLFFSLPKRREHFILSFEFSRSRFFSNAFGNFSAKMFVSQTVIPDKNFRLFLSSNQLTLITLNESIASFPFNSVSITDSQNSNICLLNFPQMPEIVFPFLDQEAKGEFLISIIKMEQENKEIKLIEKKLSDHVLMKELKEITQKGRYSNLSTEIMDKKDPNYNYFKANLLSPSLAILGPILIETDPNLLVLTTTNAKFHTSYSPFDLKMFSSPKSSKIFKIQITNQVPLIISFGNTNQAQLFKSKITQFRDQYIQENRISFKYDSTELEEIMELGDAIVSEIDMLDQHLEPTNQTASISITDSTLELKLKNENIFENHENVKIFVHERNRSVWQIQLPDSRQFFISFKSPSEAEHSFQLAQISRKKNIPKISRISNLIRPKPDKNESLFSGTALDSNKTNEASATLEITPAMLIIKTEKQQFDLSFGKKLTVSMNKETNTCKFEFSQGNVVYFRFESSEDMGKFLEFLNFTFKKTNQNGDLSNFIKEEETKQKQEEKETKQEEKETNKYTKREFNYAGFSRSFVVPKQKIDDVKISASYENGVLNISLPKREEIKPKPSRNVEIA